MSVASGEVQKVLAKYDPLGAKLRSLHSDFATLNKAATEGCDLIVMASHGRRGLEGFLLGSETQKVLTHTSIPVLVYR